MNEKTASAAQNVILENRKKLSVSGVEDVDSFDESQSVVYTNMGLIEIKGSDIHMSKLNLESGEIVLEGNFSSVVYVEENAHKPKKSWLSKMFSSEEG